MDEDFSHEEMSNFEGDEEDENFSGMDEEDYGDESDINFDDIPAYANLPPLDPWRKVRRDLLRTVSQTREEEVGGMPPVHMDWLASEGLQDYARLVLEDEEDSDRIPEMVANTRAVGSHKFCTAVTLLEEEVTESKNMIPPFMDAHGLIMELYRDAALSANLTHVGIGVGIGGKRLALVYGFVAKLLVIDELAIDGEGLLVVQGRMLTSEQGIYAGRVVEISTGREKAVVGPEAIEYDKDSKAFCVRIEVADPFEPDAEGRSHNYVELYTRGNPDTIAYGEESGQKVNVKHVELVERMRLEQYPDPRHVYEETKAHERKQMADVRQHEFELERLRHEEEMAQIRLRQRENIREELYNQEKQRALEEPAGSAASVASSKKLDVKSGLSSAGSQASPDHRRASASSIQAMSQDSESSAHSDEEIDLAQQREDLIAKVTGALEIQTALKTENSQLEKTVVDLRQRMGAIQDKTNEDSMTLHKYLNTLANVHQVQFKIGEVQETYNNWAQVYEESITDKKEKCKEIQEYFKNFKRDVATGAEYARTGKPINKKLIDEWERLEEERDSKLETVRVDNITLKNRHLKLIEQGKEKEKLAEGLHLIDYEQLKIEKQTLNEKIEERNEELLKLRRKIETTVQILTHTKEKMKFIVADKQALISEKNLLHEKLQEQRKELHDLKEVQEKTRTEYFKHKQETGIVNSKELKTDFHNKNKRVEELKERLQELQAQYTTIQANIAKAKALT